MEKKRKKRRQILWRFGFLALCFGVFRCSAKLEKNDFKTTEMEHEMDAGGSVTEETKYVDLTEENPMEKTEEKARERIICWGDSLTFGEGGDGVTYPFVLAEKAGLEVVNYGIQGETVRQIGIRAGAFPMSAEPFEIPAQSIPVEVSLRQGGEDPTMMRLGDAGINPCVIAGVEGVLAYRLSDNAYYFTRLEEGAPQSVKEAAEVETFASLDKRESDIVVLFAGSNLPPDRYTVSELIDLERQILDFIGTERFLVIGLTCKQVIPDVEQINEALAKEFGAQFLDIRSYFLEHGLEDAGIEPTKKDRKDIKKGEIPSSIRVDEIHGNADFYRILGTQVYEKLKELGYIETQSAKEP